MDISKKATTLKTNKEYINQLPKIIHPIDIYINSKTPIMVKCSICDHTWNRIPAANTGCPKCAGNLPATNKGIDKKLKNRNIKRIGNISGIHNTIEWECLIDKHIWNATPNDVVNKNKSGCPLCKAKSSKGKYQCMSKEIADSLGYNLYIYIIKLTYKDETFYKIGLTKNIDRRRYRQYTPYKVIEELEFMEFRAFDAIIAERYMHEIYNKYQPNYQFGGWNECITEDTI